jgi:hypothetical protein
VRYPRDPTLDPQLVWKGKDEQDARDLEVPAVPIYIQETIDPLALVEELRAESEGRRSEQQLVSWLRRRCAVADRDLWIDNLVHRDVKRVERDIEVQRDCVSSHSHDLTAPPRLTEDTG